MHGLGLLKSESPRFLAGGFVIAAISIVAGSKKLNCQLVLKNISFILLRLTRFIHFGGLDKFSVETCGVGIMGHAVMALVEVTRSVLIVTNVQVRDALA